MDTLSSWTDDIPICKQAGIGSATNEIYRKDGKRAEMHAMQDRYFHFSQDEYKLSLYGLFDGFTDATVADFAMKRFPAELLLGQLSQNSADDTVKEALRQAFTTVDREYFDNIINAITSRLVLKQDPKVTPDNPNLVRVDTIASVGASATITVILNDKIFVAGCGDTKAVLCLMLPNGELKAVPLSVDHVLGNEDEDLRLVQLGLDPDKLEHCLSPHGYTRCLGNHKVKGGYKEEEGLKGAKDEPVIADPEIHGGIPLEPSFQFLLMFTRSLTDCLSEVASTDGDIVKELCRLTMEQFAENTSVTGVAQSVVDQIVRRHREQFEFDDPSMVSPVAYRTREDISLLVRNMNAKLKKKKSSVTSPGVNDINDGRSSFGGLLREADSTVIRDPTKARPTLSSTTTTTESSADGFYKNSRGLNVDEDGCIKPYVDFSYFNEKWATFKALDHHQQSNCNGKNQ